LVQSSLQVQSSLAQLWLLLQQSLCQPSAALGYLVLIEHSYWGLEQ
jgi:hypothetical protein